MTELVITERLSEHITNALNSGLLVERERDLLERCQKNGRITTDCVKILRRYISQHNSSAEILSLKLLLQGTKLTFPGFAKNALTKNDELEARRRQLVIKQEEREYNKMVFGSERNPDLDKVLGVKNEFASQKNQFTIGINMLVAMFSTFAICYYVGRQFTENQSTLLILGLVGAIGILILEMVLFIMRAVQMENTFEKPLSANRERLAKARSGAIMS